MTSRLTLILVSILASPAVAQQHHGLTGEHTNPHPHDPVLRAEHLAMLALVKPADETHRAIQSGRWSEPPTWANQKIPAAGAHVLIPNGITVTLDYSSAVAHRTIRVDGILQFDPDKDTSLVVDTLVVAPSGRLLIGTKERPIAADKTATITFSDEGPIDTKWDPELLSRGLISHGITEMHGAPKTSFLALSRPPRKGDTKLHLGQAPVNWKVGDQLVLTGTTGLNREDESKIVALSGNEVTVAPLKFDHTTPQADLVPYVGNLTRNVIVQSQNRKDPSRLGHVMFMHSPGVALHNAAFYDLGRTDKRIPIDDPKLDKQGRLIAGTGRNPRGRYAVHFHRTGIDRHSKPIQVRGCAVANSPGWGFTNHSSHVHFEDNLAYNVDGAAFVGEAGDEIGTFRHNLAVRSRGSGQNFNSRRKLADFGHEGDGFWFQGGGVVVEDNIASGQRSSGFFFFTVALEQEGLGTTRFPVANLEDPSWARGKQFVDVPRVPIRSFKNNCAFACMVGFQVAFHQPPLGYRSVLEGGTVWGSGRGVIYYYTHHLVLRNLRLIGKVDHPSGWAITGGVEDQLDITYENLHVEGWAYGLSLSRVGDQLVKGGYYNNITNIHIPIPRDHTRKVRIEGDIRFGSLSTGALNGRSQYDLFMNADINYILGNRPGNGQDLNTLFAPDVVRLDTPQWKNQQLFYVEQAADFVPFRPKNPFPGAVPADLVDKTNQQMWDKYRLALAGVIAPKDAVQDPRIHGLLSKPSTYPPSIRMASSPRPKRAGPYLLTATDAQGRMLIKTYTSPLQGGWNVISHRIGKEIKSFLVYSPEKSGR